MNSTSPSHQLSASYGSNLNLALQQRNYPGMPGQPPSSQSTGGTQSPSRFFANGPARGILPNVPNQSGNNAASQTKRMPGMPSLNPPSSGQGFIGGYSRTVSGNENGVLNFDPSEFPSLGNRNPVSLSSGSQASLSRNYVNVMSKPQIQDSSSEFQIQPEEFPALPGKTGATSALESVTGDSKLSSDTSSYDQIRDKSQGVSRKGIITHPDGTITNIPNSMVLDQFGMVGLLTFIRTAEKDPQMVPLAPGIDLTTLGLNLNSPDNLYSTFQSPWADSPCRPQDIDYHVPTEYLTNMFIKDKLAPIRLGRYGENLLFYLFYMSGGDFMQLASAAELHNRDWRYHKEEKLWITRIPGREPETKTQYYERGLYYFFDPQNWLKQMKQFHLEYEKLEDKPQLPTEYASQAMFNPLGGMA